MRLAKRLQQTALAMAAVAACLASTAEAQSPAEFYKGKTINVYVGYAPGGSYDFYPRLFARHFGKYIPGNPNVVIQTMPGAGSLRAANYLFNVAPRDGTSLGVVTQTVMLEEAFGTPGVKYKATEFSYVGRMTGVLEVMIIWGDAKAKTIADVRKYETIAGSTGPSSPTEGYPRLLNAFAGAKFRIVGGFNGTAELMLAMERGEVDALENSWTSILRTKKEWVDNRRINVLVQAAFDRSKELPHTPTLVEMGTNPDDQAALALYTSSAAVSRSLLGSPGIPSDRLQALREAFMATTRDPQLLEEVKQSQAEFDPAPGEFLQDLARKVAATPREIVERTAAALHAK